MLATYSSGLGGESSFFCVCNFSVTLRTVSKSKRPTTPKIRNKTMMRVHVPWETRAIYKGQAGWRRHLLFIPCKAIIASFHLYLQTLSGLCSCITFTITARVRRSLIHRTRQQPPSCSSCSFPCQLILSAPPRPQPLNLFPCCWQRGFSKT